MSWASASSRTSSLSAGASQPLAGLGGGALGAGGGGGDTRLFGGRHEKARAKATKGPLASMLPIWARHNAENAQWGPFPRKRFHEKRLFLWLQMVPEHVFFCNGVFRHRAVKTWDGLITQDHASRNVRRRTYPQLNHASGNKKADIRS